MKQIIKKFIQTKKSNVAPIFFIDSISHFFPEICKPKRALVTLPPFAWQEVLKQEPNIKNFNFTGLLYEIVKNLNQKGFMVDILDLNCDNYELKYKYDLLVGHGGGLKHVILQMPPNVPILQYVSGAYYECFIEETASRYNRFKKKNHISFEMEIRRKMVDSIQGENLLAEKATFLFSCFAPRMIETYKEKKDKFFFTGLAAYIDKKTFVDKRYKQFEKGKNNFIYVGGTSGNIQKGMDLIIEAFAEVPEANLYIYCEIENEILKYYKRELSLPNVKYIYHYKFLGSKLNKLMHRINYTVHAPINTGLGTAFAGTMGAGLIPVGYVDLVKNQDWNILCDEPTVEGLVMCIENAIKKDSAWCKSASEKVTAHYYENWTPENFSKNFNKLLNLAIK